MGKNPINKGYLRHWFYLNDYFHKDPLNKCIAIFINDLSGLIKKSEMAGIIKLVFELYNEYNYQYWSREKIGTKQFCGKMTNEYRRPKIGEIYRGEYGWAEKAEFPIRRKCNILRPF